MAVAAVALSFGVGPLAHHVQSLADWIVQALVPSLLVLVVFLYLSLLRATLRCPVRVYVGTDPKIRRVVKRCPSFQKDYRPPAWAAGAWAQAVIYLYRSWRNQHLRGLIREQVELPDGEFVHLMWMLPPSLRTEATSSATGGDVSESDAPNVPASVPIVVICHGVFQSAADLYEFCSFLTNQCGYLACVFSRRGNDTPLSRPRFNTVGDQEDFRFILSRIRGRFPTHRLYGVGISAGSSLLARYLGDAGEDAELDGGVLVSPGYDMEKSLRHMTPLADMVITLHAKSFFLTRNKDTLASPEHQDGLLKLYRSRSMHEFHQHMHVFDGKASSEEYFNTHNPGAVLDKIRKPSVYINAYDDMCFPGDFTFQYKNLVDRCHHALVLHMEKGGHGTFYEGWDAGTSRFFQVVREFVDCLHHDEGFADKAAEGEAVVEATAAAAAPASSSSSSSSPSSVTLTKTLTTLTTVTRGEEEALVATRVKERKEVLVVGGPQSRSGTTTMTTTTVMREVRRKGEGLHEVIVRTAIAPQ